MTPTLTDGSTKTIKHHILSIILYTSATHITPPTMQIRHNSNKVDSEYVYRSLFPLLHLHSGSVSAGSLVRVRLPSPPRFYPNGGGCCIVQVPASYHTTILEILPALEVHSILHMISTCITYRVVDNAEFLPAY